MTTYLLLYLFVMLDSIKLFFYNKYGISFSVIIISFIYLGARAAFVPDSDGDKYPFSGFFSGDNEIKNKLIKLSSKIQKGIIYIVIFQFICNMLYTFIPSTKQAAFIIVGGKGLQSDTMKAISSIDSEFAKYIEMKAKEYTTGKIKIEKSKLKKVIK